MCDRVSGSNAAIESLPLSRIRIGTAVLPILPFGIATDNMFDVGPQVDRIAEFLALADRPAFTRISRATCEVLITPAQVLHAPLHNAVEAFDDLTPIFYITVDIAVHRSNDDNIISIMRLQDHLVSRRLDAAICRGFGHVEKLSVYDLTVLLTNLVLRRSVGQVPLPLEVWHELVKDGWGPMDPVDLLDVSPAVPWLLEGWRGVERAGHIRPGAPCTIASIVLVFNQVATLLHIMHSESSG